MNDRSHYVQSRFIYIVWFEQNDKRQEQNKWTASAGWDNRQCVSGLFEMSRCINTRDWNESQQNLQAIVLTVLSSNIQSFSCQSPKINNTFCWCPRNPVLSGWCHWHQSIALIDSVVMASHTNNIHVPVRNWTKYQCCWVLQWAMWPVTNHLYG